MPAGVSNLQLTAAAVESEAYHTGEELPFCPQPDSRQAVVLDRLSCSRQEEHCLQPSKRFLRMQHQQCRASVRELRCEASETERCWSRTLTSTRHCFRLQMRSINPSPNIVEAQKTIQSQPTVVAATGDSATMAKPQRSTADRVEVSKPI